MFAELVLRAAGRGTPWSAGRRRIDWGARPAVHRQLRQARQISPEVHDRQEMAHYE